MGPRTGRRPEGQLAGQCEGQSQGAALRAVAAMKSLPKRIAFAAHAALDSAASESLAVSLCSVRATAVRMMHEPRTWSARLDGHFESRKRDVAIDGLARCPPNNSPREQVQDDRQVEPPLIRM